MRCLIAARERGFFECFDLALLLLRKFNWRLALAGLPGMVVIALVSLVLGWKVPPEEDLLFTLLAYVLLVPLVSVPVVWVLGQLVFELPITRRRIWDTFKRSWWPLVLCSGLVRWIYLLLVLPYLAYPLFVQEVIVLEQQATRAAMKRVRALERVTRRPALLWQLAFALVGFVFVVGVLWGLTAVNSMIAYQLAFEEDPFSWMGPGAWLGVLVLLWPLTVYLTTARFCGYLDLRTRAEGWAVERGLREFAEGRRETI